MNIRRVIASVFSRMFKSLDSHRVKASHVKASAMRNPTNVFVLFTFGLFSVLLFSGLLQLITTSFKISGLLFLGLPQMLLSVLSPIMPALQVFGLVFGLGSLIVAAVTVPILLFKEIFATPNDEEFDILP